MSSQTVRPTALLADLDHRAAVARLEVALLVEDAVVGQEDLAVDRVHDAVGEHGGGVVDVLRALGKADDGDDPLGLGGELAQRRAGGSPGSARAAADPRAGSRSAPARGTARCRRRPRAPARARRESAQRCRRCRRRWRSSGRGPGARSAARWRGASAAARAARRLCACAERLSRRPSWCCASPAELTPAARASAAIARFRSSAIDSSSGSASKSASSPKPRWPS